MASKKDKKIQLVPEIEANRGYIYTTYAPVRHDRKKLRLKKFNPKTGKHEWFIEVKGKWK